MDGNLTTRRGEGSILLSCELRLDNVKARKGSERTGSKSNSEAKNPMDVNAVEVSLAFAQEGQRPQRDK